MTMYAEIKAKDLKVGDKVLTRYHDTEGSYQEVDALVTAVKVFARKVRIIFEGFGVQSVPADKVFGVKGVPATPREQKSFARRIAEMTFEQKVKALIDEGGYERGEAVALLHDLGEFE